MIKHTSKKTLAKDALKENPPLIQTPWDNLFRLDPITERAFSAHSEFKKKYPRGFRWVNDYTNKDPNLISRIRAFTRKALKKYNVHYEGEGNAKRLYSEDLGDLPEDLLMEKFTEAISVIDEILRKPLDKYKGEDYVEGLHKLPGSVRRALRSWIETKDKEKPIDEDITGGESLIVDTLLFAIFNEAYEKLTPREKTVIHYRIVKGLTPQATAKELGVTVQAVNKMEKNALKKLKAKG